MVYERHKRKYWLIVLGLTIGVILHSHLLAITKFCDMFIPYKTGDNLKEDVHHRDIDTVYISENYTGIPCNHSFDLSEEEALERVASYKFPGVQDYIRDLFPNRDHTNLPDEPIYVSGFSADHFAEGLAMINNFTKTVNINRTKDLLVYDIGLTVTQLEKLEAECNSICRVRRFPFDVFPEYVRTLRGYAWKPLLIQLAAKEHPFVIWIDASIRFKTNNIDAIVQETKARGVLVHKGSFKIAYHTTAEMFRFLNEPPCLYVNSHEAVASFICVYQTPFIVKYFMKPWVSCALSRGCMVPNNKVYELRVCHGLPIYFECHRFEQSMMGILLNRLFQKDVENYYLTLEHYTVCRGCTDMN